ncbi:MAG: hypothetical protein OEY23_23425 [Acidimicrobiia bacterium]|nr:hypothetical protein [Acidimicrobiia bacterium]
MEAFEAWRTGATDIAEIVHEESVPFAGRCAWNALASVGPVRRAVAHTAATLRRWNDALDEFDAPVAECATWGMPPWQAISLLEMAAVAQQAGRPAALVEDLAARAVSLADSIGASAAAARARDFLRTGLFR